MKLLQPTYTNKNKTKIMKFYDELIKFRNRLIIHQGDWNIEWVLQTVDSSRMKNKIYRYGSSTAHATQNFRLKWISTESANAGVY